MAWRLDEFLDQDPVVAERAGGLPLGRFKGGGKIRRPVDPAHPLAAAAGRGLDQHRIADFSGPLGQPVRILIVAVITRHNRHFRHLHQRLGGAFRSHRPDRIGRWTDEFYPCRRAGLGKAGILRKKAVTGMDRLRARLLRRLDDPIADQIALRRRRRPDPDRFVRLQYMLRAGIGIRIDRHGAHPHPARRADHPAGDLSAVGDQDSVEHAAGAVSPRPARPACASRGKRSRLPCPRRLRGYRRSGGRSSRSGRRRPSGR